LDQRNGNLRAFEPGNRAAERHSFYATKLTSAESEEIAEIADVLRELSPVSSDALEPLLSVVAAQLWRQRKAYADLARNGVVRRNGRPAAILKDLSTLENALMRGLAALALEPQAAANLGLTMKRTEALDRADFDPGRLTIKEREQLEKLLTKAETDAG
jgi:hypothetical protein